MSRLTKFLQQTCILEMAVRNNDGVPVLNKFGEKAYASPVTIKCRRERTTKDVLTANGSALRSDSIYYTDETHIIRPDDKLDGRVVLSVEEYVNGLGRVEGFVSHA